MRSRSPNPSSADLQWSVDGDRWPNREHSRFVEAAGLRWHLQDLGAGPVLLLVHGAGASSHSWAALAPRLAARFRVIVPDLPGHGFTELPAAQRSSLPEMARALAALVNRLGIEPALAVGHSAGAAVLARMCLDGAIEPRGLISINGALLPLRGIPRQLFAPAAKLLARIPKLPHLFARSASDRRKVERLIDQTGSRLTTEGVDLYHRLTRSPKQVTATLQMMASWDLTQLGRELVRLRPVIHLIACENDQTVPPAEAGMLSRLLPEARLHRLEGLGHLGHEEDPERFARLITDIAGELDVLERQD